MEMVSIKANRLKSHPRHTPQQLGEYLPEVATYARIQDPAAVLAHPHHMIL